MGCRFEQFTLSRWAANEQFEILVALILRNTPLRQPSVLTAKSLRRILQITEGITADIFHVINSLAIEGIKAGESGLPTKSLRNGSRNLTPKQPSHEVGRSARQLPVTLAPHTDEFLSSWITRHAAFYEVPPLAMLQHCLPEVLSLRTADLDLTEGQVVRIACMSSVDPATVRRMTFSNIAQSSRRLIASKPRQCCSCRSTIDGLQTILRSHFLGWRITCRFVVPTFRALAA